jgi:hypothetical protein
MVKIPWAQLTDQLAEILVEDALDRASDKGVRLDRAALQQAATRAWAQELVEREIISLTRQLVKDLTLSAIDGNADAGELRERIMNSPAFSKARAVMLARVALENGRRLSTPLAGARKVDLAYWVTSHASQGSTGHKAIINIDSSRHVDLVNDHHWYVSKTRPEWDLRIYTDSVEGMRRATTRTQEKELALDVLKQPRPSMRI